MTQGTYLALRVLQPSIDLIYNHCLINGIPAKKQEYDLNLHVTVIYSVKPCPKLFAEPGVTYKACPKGYELFTGDHGNTVLVLLLDAPEVEHRHKHLMKKHGASYDYPTYNPHITLSYNFTGDISQLTPPEFCIRLGKEFHEHLTPEKVYE